MQQHDSNPKVFLTGSQGKNTNQSRKRKPKNDAVSKEIRQIEKQKVLRALAASAVPLTSQQIKTVTGNISNLKLLIAYLKHQRCLEVAFRAKSPIGPFEEDYYRLIRPASTEGRPQYG